MYRVTVSWANGTPADDNPFKASATTVRFDWESQS